VGQLLEALGVAALVRVILERGFPVRLLDLVIAGGGADAEGVAVG
jgi:hypothetical protein